MFAGDLYLSFLVILFSRVISSQAIKVLLSSTSINLVSIVNLTDNGNGSITVTSPKNLLDQGKETARNIFLNMGRGTVVRATIVFAGITCLVLMYIGIKTFL
jgi:hypothetical protein